MNGRIVFALVIFIGCVLGWSSVAQASVESVVERAKAQVLTARGSGLVQSSATRADFEKFVKRQASLEAQVGLAFYRTRDDYRAITALRRYQVLADSDDAKYISQLLIGHIYHRQKKPGLSAYNYERAIGVAPSTQARLWVYLLGMQELCLPLGLYLECRNRLIQLRELEGTSKEQQELLLYKQLYVDVTLRQPHVRKINPSIFEVPTLREHAKGLLKQDRAFDELSLQSPALAAVFSGVLPGAGQLYNGRYVDGAVAFGLNAGLGVATYYAFFEMDNVPLGVISGALLVGFYLGNIINAYTDAERINAERYLGFFEKLKKEHWPRVRFDVRGGVVEFGYGFDWDSDVSESQPSPSKERSEDGASDRGELL